ncbi:hypothetical protein GCM10010191_90820 [Actinomadura vinacea]|uniref:DUF397 domain-containing protein n=1 Tax=Actinomadura vinacea TaxID=115336 RepID=A0ABN3KEC6_9ACTN
MLLSLLKVKMAAKARLIAGGRPVAFPVPDLCYHGSGRDPRADRDIAFALCLAADAYK